jgi:hypothetical protein
MTISKSNTLWTFKQIAQSGPAKAIRRQGDRKPKHGKLRWIVRNGKAVTASS